MGFRTALAAVALLLLLVAAGFAGVARNGFAHLDDAAYLTENPVVAEGLTPRGLAWAFTTTTGSNWHPLAWVAHQLNVDLFGMRPGGHHAASLLLHAANALLLFAALRGMTGATGRSAAAAALFAVHPLHVESVAWASELKDLLSTLLALAALHAHLAAVRRPAPGRRAAVAVFLALALLAKPMPVTLPFLLLLLDWWPLGRWAPRPGGGPLRLLPPAALWREKLPLFLLAGASSAVTWAVQAGSGATAWGSAIPMTTRVANALLSYLRYLDRTLWPRDLAIHYPYPLYPPAWVAWGGALLLLALATRFALRRARRGPWLAAGWLWYLGTLVPVIGLVQVGSQGWADRYSYLPLAGVFVAAAWGVAALAGGRPALRVPLGAAAAVAVAALLLATRAQVRVWETNETLFTHALAATEGNALAHESLGIALAQEGRHDEAVRHFEASLAIQPDASETLFNLGHTLDLAGRREEAAARFEQALALDPGNEAIRRALQRARTPPRR